MKTSAFKERGGCAGGGKGYLGSEELAFTLSRSQDQNIMQPIILNDQGGGVMNIHQDGNVGTLRAQTHGNEQIVSYGISSNVINRKPENGGHQISGCTEEEAPTLTKADRHATAYSIQGSVIGREDHNGPMGSGIKEEEEAFCLNTIDKQAVVFNHAQITSPQNGSNPVAGDPSPTLAKGGQQHIVVKENGDGNDRLADTLVKGANQLTGTDIALHKNVMVRRLTPMECERLQGFPDGYTMIDDVPQYSLSIKMRKGRVHSAQVVSTDARRYAALGNSMTTNVMKWLGQRIQAVDEIMAEL